MISKRKVIISLAMNFSVLWALSLLVWMVRYKAIAMVMIWLVPTAPLFYGFRFLVHSAPYPALISLLISALTFSLCLLAVRNRRLFILIAAHITLVIYWILSFFLILIGLRLIG